MTFAKLLLLLAVLLMPFGMTPAAVAGPVSAHTSMPVQHCPEQAPNHGAKAGFTECTMACSAALPPAETRSDQPLLIACAPDLFEALRQLHGLHPETATPPPKRS
ncbi:MAG: hypothetical protein ACJ8E3_07950 [Sphingomicrobium sp.]